MNKELILRVRSPEGQHRVTVMTRDTYGELQLELSKKLNYFVKDLIIQTEDGRMLSVKDGMKLGDVPYFKDGAILKVDSKNPKKKEPHSGMKVEDVKGETLSAKCNHPPGGKCLNCIQTDTKKTEGKPEESKSGCNHGPNGKCLNCAAVDPKDKDKPANTKWMCKHGPNAKCCHCLDAQFISDTAHISFDQFLEDKKLKCKGVHPSDVKCNNCLPPQRIRYEVDKTCKKHEPYPKAMCNKCLPPSVIVKRQEYRHVDYVEFMNIAQIQDYVKYWVQNKHMAEQRVGYLYGYYSEDPHYKGGIRLIIEALYEPEQKGTYSDFEITERKEKTHKADMVATGLSLERVGWIYTETNHDCTMNEKQVRHAARMQQQYRVAHSSGYDISNFVTVILRTDEKNPNDVKPEVYTVSDQGQALQAAGMFVDSSSRKLMQVKVAKSNKQAYPNIIVGGKEVETFEPEFLLVKIAHGSSRSNKFAILKKSEFPAINRDKPSKVAFKEYMKKNKHKVSHTKYGDFNLLMYLVEETDIHTVMSIAEEVQKENNIAEAIDELIEHKADL